MTEEEAASEAVDEEKEDGEDDDEEEETKGDNSAAKTPVSLLQELYVRRGVTPKYDLVQIEGQVHEPTFKYRVTVGEFVATGCGQSKKKAKHCAAKSILDKLIGAQNSGKAAADQPTIPDLATEILSPYDDGIQGNPVGLLQELCMSRRWPPPTYDLSHEEGLPHERSFTIKCIIEGKHLEVGAGKSKKLAKRQAANKMIQRLRDIPTENEDAFQHIDDDMLAQGLAHVKEASFKSSSSSHSQQVSRFHRNLRGSQGEILEQLQSLTLSDPCPPDHPTYVKFLEEIAEEQKFEVTYVDIEEISKSGKHQCLVQLSTLPVAVCFGDGDSPESAQDSAAQNSLEYLQIMTNK